MEKVLKDGCIMMCQCATVFLLYLKEITWSSDSEVL